MPDRDALIDELAGNENRYLLVRPGGGLYGSHEAVNVWNGDTLRRGEKDELIEWARDYIVHSTSFDYVLVVHGAKEAED